jgi:SAM-dependent methyltransferase
VSGHRLEWLERNACPACGGTAQVGAVRLFQQQFHFGGTALPPPPQRIMLARCADCTLVYKTLVPSPALLQQLTAHAQAGLWTGRYDYADEIAAVRSLDPEALFDAIEIGAAGGGFLAALPEGGRKSALDIVRFDTLRINGEFITGFLDDNELGWSGKHYALAGLFDVAEHLYDPPRAFANLRRLCRTGGLVIAETGDSGTVSPGRLARWHYVNLIEHHLAWNRASFEAIATKSGFSVEQFERKTHKGSVPLARIGPRQRMKLAGFAIAPRLMEFAWRAAGRPFSVPAAPDVDHFRIILRAV